MRQSEAAEIAGVKRSVYIDIECGTTRHIPMNMAEKLAEFYEVPVGDFMDEFDQFLLDGQANRIRAYREKTHMGRKTFSRFSGIPLSSLRDWENERKTISRKSWEKYFKGRA